MVTTKQLVNAAKDNIQGDNKIALLNCYHNRLKLGCTYPPIIEKQLDKLHEVCEKILNVPWWWDIMD
tara:strand:+ start:3176 stop:3376 length:201 start_codon:yes stop_codon:yes gene_type:complete